MLPYAFALNGPEGWFPIYEWLRDSALVSLQGVSPDKEGIAGHFGPGSPSYQQDIAALKALYQENADLETIRVQRRLWYDLLRTALGEIAFTTEGMSELFRTALGDIAADTEEMDDLLLHSEANDAGNVNPSFDSLVERARVEQDREARLELYREAEQLLMDDAGIIPLFHVKDYVLVGPHVHGFTISPVGQPFLSGITLGAIGR